MHSCTFVPNAVRPTAESPTRNPKRKRCENQPNQQTNKQTNKQTSPTRTKRTERTNERTDEPKPIEQTMKQADQHTGPLERRTGGDGTGLLEGVDLERFEPKDVEHRNERCGGLCDRLVYALTANVQQVTGTRRSSTPPVTEGRWGAQSARTTRTRVAPRRASKRACRTAPWPSPQPHPPHLRR
jgi:hypothetical protein